MKILSKNHSSYPRVGDKPEQQRLRRAYNQFDAGKITADEVARTLDVTVAEIIEEQLQSGCDLITDGQIRAHDPLSHLAGKIDGFEIAGLLRFFDTNYLFRQPKVIGTLKYRQPLIANDFKISKKYSSGKLTAVMFGPYSLLKMSNCPNNFEEHLEELIAIYAFEIKALMHAGADLVQFDEPAIIFHREDMSLFNAAYAKLMAEPGLPQVALAFYFGNAAPFITELAEIPVDGFLFDFTYSPGLAEAIAGIRKNIGLGVIDGRNTKMEKPELISKQAESIIRNIKSKKVCITSSCGLEFLPRDRAFSKLKLCADIARTLRGDR